MKIILLLTLLHFGAAFGWEETPQMVSFQRVFVNSQRVKETGRQLIVGSPANVPTDYTLSNFRTDLSKVFNEQGLSQKQVGQAFWGVMNVGGKELPILECTLKKLAKGVANLQRSYIVCSNRPPSKGSNPPQPQTGVRSFPLFRNNPGVHPFQLFQNNHAVYVRAVSSQDNLAQLAFLKDSVKRLVEIANKVTVRSDVGTLYEAAKKAVAEAGNKDVEVREKFRLPNAIGFDLFSKNKGLKAYQVLAFTVNAEYLGLDFSIYDKSHLIIVSKQNIESAEAEIKAVLDSIPPEDDLERLDVGDMPKKVREYVNGQCKNDPQEVTVNATGLGDPREKPSCIQMQSKRTKAPPAKSEDVCQFQDTAFMVLYFHYGYMQYFLVSFDSKQLWYESALVADKVKFDAKFGQVMGLIKDNIDLVLENQAKSTMEVFVSKEGIEAALQQGLGEQPKPEEFSAQEKAVFSKARMTPVAKYGLSQAGIEVRVLQTPEEFVIKLSKKKGDKFTPVSGEITVPLSNGYDYQPLLVKNLQDFLSKAQEQTGGAEVSND